MSVNRRRFAVLAVVLVTVNVFFWLAGSGFALPGGGGGLLQTLLGGRLIRAEIVWQAPDGTIRDSQLYRGVITSVSSTTITLRELDGRSVPITVDVNARVQGPARFSSVSRLRPRLRVVLYHQANQPVQLVQVEGTG